MDRRTLIKTLMAAPLAGFTGTALRAQSQTAPRKGNIVVDELQKKGFVVYRQDLNKKAA